MRKKVDSRIRTLVENCAKLRQRGMFVIIGDKGRDQVCACVCVPVCVCLIHVRVWCCMSWVCGRA
jgi:hypothetical protein